MTTLPDRPNTALLVIDVQNGVVAGAPRRDEVVANISSLVDRARAEEVPVVWVQHYDDNLPRDSEVWQYVPELVREDSEPLVHKTYGDSFEGTDLEERLAERGVGQLIVTGAQTDACVRSTIHGAFTRGYDVTLVGDAHTTEDLSDTARRLRRRSSPTPTSTGRSRAHPDAARRPSTAQRCASPKQGASENPLAAPRRSRVEPPHDTSSRVVARRAVLPRRARPVPRPNAVRR